MPLAVRHRLVAVVRHLALLHMAAAILCSLLSSKAYGQQGNEKTFASPGEAAAALYAAVKSNDSQTLATIFGSQANKILHTGDDVADKNMAATFLRAYDQMHRVVLEPDQTATLYIGAENWPFPISIVKNSNGAWYFDTEGGEKEILYRRVGANENDAIEILHGLVAAQLDYAAASRDGAPAGQYAPKFISDQGRHNGLYWATSGDEPPSPIGPALVAAAAQGYSFHQGQSAPFHGYFFRLLTKQGEAAKGGAIDYVVDGKLTKGFAFVAYPAEYRNSGVMTFIVNKSGVVYQRDLGAQTAAVASAMQEYNPDSTWEKVD
jgi:hypothetical protein